MDNNEAFNDFTCDLQTAKLTDEEREELEGYITIEECAKVLKTFPPCKSPGDDGFTAEFYCGFFLFSEPRLSKSLYWNLEMFQFCGRSDTRVPRERPLSKERTNSKVNSHMVLGWNRTLAKFVGGDRSHYCTILSSSCVHGMMTLCALE